MACLGLGGTEVAGAERTARHLVRLAPLHESGYGLLMGALEAQGNVAEALVVYEALRQRLRNELGVSPAEPLQTAYRRLLGASSGGVGHPNPFPRFRPDPASMRRRACW